MVIVYITKWYSEKMGYIENCLPFSVAKLGHEVHILTSTAQVYYDTDFYEKSYKDYLGEPILSRGKNIVSNVTIHRLPFTVIKSQIVIKGLLSALSSIKPDVVHVFEHNSLDTYRVAFAKIFLRYKLFTANHSVMSVFPIGLNWDKKSFFAKLKWNFFTKLPGMFVSIVTTKCFAVTEDAGYIAVRWLGVPSSKLKVTTLGVDTNIFNDNIDEETINEFRSKLGFSTSDIVCIYTGRFTKEKNPLLLAQAVNSLSNSGLNYKALFIGEGEQKKEIESVPGIKVLDFAPYHLLPIYYASADIGVWPGQESTSQLDAVAAGVNLILTDNIKAYSLIFSTESSGKPKIVSAFYEHANLESLIKELKALYDNEKRLQLSRRGMREIYDKYSWNVIAEQRILDYK